ncbi:STAS domain-containing protein [Phormidium yuhuli AB48]|uniref:Anti-sigma factor antagonist n=1 Tax=Phormidium yuhuli AB48 TaxID=2940671 RepID=A0ABY5ATA6_9CYAN|nr:STAS domain-containing protein [Phormidium yuhuli]USR92146.1 STAS domain-containing protein [Phormidium yuhuli AB48]
MHTATQAPNVTVIRLEGHLNAANAEQVREQLTSAVAAQTAPMVVVDMEQTQSLDSAGLMALVSALKLAQRINIEFALCAVSPAIRIIFELTQLDRVFNMLESSAAVEATA